MTRSGKVTMAGMILAGIMLIYGWFIHPVLTVMLGVLMLAGAGYITVWRYKHARSATIVNRWTSRAKKHQGVASFWTILRVSSGWAMRRNATVLRPHLAGVSRLARWCTPITEYAAPIMWAGWLRVFTPCEDVTVAVGGPRTGKSGQLACHILDAPGAVIVTSTRTDLYDNTRNGRERKGPVYVFNPSGVGGLPSTITFSPLAGCTDPTIATARATDLLSATGRITGGDGDHWMNLAKLSLAPLLHAAALGEGTMWDVRSWIADPERIEPLVMRLLKRSPGQVLNQDARQFFAMGDRTRSSICAIIMPGLSWLNDPRAEQATRVGGFDVGKLITDKGAVYLLGAEDAQVAPVVAAFTGHIAREARRVAGLQPKGRLNPPLTLALDEAALICPIPLDKWTADMGGRNITIHIRAQSRAQLRQRWGDVGSSAILNNASTVLIFGGTRDVGDLSEFSALTGDRYEDDRRVPVLTPSQIAQLPAGHALLIRRGMPPVVGKPLMVWRRHRYRRLVTVPFAALTSAWTTYRMQRTAQQTVTRRPIAALPMGHTARAERDALMAESTSKGSTT